jgi:hypothetical protein
LLLSTIHYQRTRDDSDYNNDNYIAPNEHDSKHKANTYFDGSTELSRRLEKAETLYQRQVSARGQYISENNV